MALHASSRAYPTVGPPRRKVLPPTSPETPPKQLPQRAMPMAGEKGAFLGNADGAASPAPVACAARHGTAAGHRQTRRARVPVGKGWERVERAQVPADPGPSGSSQCQPGASAGSSGRALWHGFWEALGPAPAAEAVSEKRDGPPSPAVEQPVRAAPLSGRESASRSMQTILGALEASQRTPKRGARTRPRSRHRPRAGAAQELGAAASARHRAACTPHPGAARSAEMPRAGGQAASAQEWVHLLASLKEQRKYHEVLEKYAQFVAELKRGTVVGPSAIPFNIAMSAALKLRSAETSGALASLQEDDVCAEPADRQSTAGVEQSPFSEDLMLGASHKRGGASGEGHAGCSKGEELGRPRGELTEGKEGGLHRLGSGPNLVSSGTQHSEDFAGSGGDGCVPCPQSVLEDMLSLRVCPSKATLRLLLASCTAPPHANEEGPSAAAAREQEGVEAGTAAGDAPGCTTPAQGLPPSDAAAAILLRLRCAGFGSRPALAEWMAQIFFGRPHSAPRLSAGLQLACSLGREGVVLSRYTVVGALGAAKQLKVRTQHPQLHHDLATMLALSQQAFHRQQALRLHADEGRCSTGDSGARPPRAVQRWTRQGGVGAPAGKEIVAVGADSRRDSQRVIE